MALVKTTLTTALTSVFNDLTGKTAEQKADEIATAFDDYIKTASVSVTVTTTGSASAQTGTGTGSLS